MDLFFNELSMEGKECIDKDSVQMLAKVYQALRESQITTCRIASADNHKLFKMIQELPDSLNIKNFYFAFFRSPYETESVEQEQDEYLAHDWRYNTRPCIGLALAVIFRSAVLSLCEPVWNVPFLSVEKDGDPSSVKNICTEEHVALHVSKLQSEEEPELTESGLAAEEKKISLRDDHGMNVLMDFSKRLVRSPYVTAVINSLPFNPTERKFIRKVRDDGLIEIVLPWTDKGYGVVVKTTGRNIRETKKISEILNEKYGGI